MSRRHFPASRGVAPCGGSRTMIQTLLRMTEQLAAIRERYQQEMAPQQHGDGSSAPAGGGAAPQGHSFAVLGI